MFYPQGFLKSGPFPEKIFKKHLETHKTVKINKKSVRSWFFLK